MSFRVVDLTVLLAGGYRMCDYSGEGQGQEGGGDPGGQDDHDDCAGRSEHGANGDDDQDPTVPRQPDDQGADQRDTLALLRDRLHQSLEMTSPL